MPLEKSDAFMLKAFNWSESSRTVIFFTREFGKLALVDKGGRRVSGKRGRLMPFARMELTFHISEKSSRGYVSDSDLLELYEFQLEGSLGRLAYASAACELLNLLLPEGEPLPSLFTYTTSFFEKTNSVDRRSLPALFVTFFLRLLSQLGYHPSLGYCIGCGLSWEESSPDNGTVAFSPERGGYVCPSCQRVAEYYIWLSSGGYRLLTRLQTCSLDEASLMPIGYQDCSLMLDLLTRFLSYQAGVSGDLKSLEFLEKLKNSQLGPDKG
ncbi:DNA repair protein RecO [candidate division GN15 bacterium]|uniref:DNA repair protein RecO n=1 Tax=candidate division GN15 bacterium TaxID=2072418 RepID=A0A855X3N6_9BACT|nr:MAG: DNA repair protein RecO [candidate division GN15 bacterium]